MGEHHERVVIVTGAASDIGRELVVTIVSEGGYVVAVDRDPLGLRWTEQLSEVVSILGDVATPETNEYMTKAAIEAFGRLDGLALATGLPPSVPDAESDDRQFDHDVAVNMRALVLGVRSARSALVESRGAVVLAATASGDGIATAAALQFTRYMATELGPAGVRVNAVCPGLLDPPSGVHELTAATTRDANPLRRSGQPGEVAEVMSFLLSQRASYVTGAIVPVDGGLAASASHAAQPVVARAVDPE